MPTPASAPCSAPAVLPVHVEGDVDCRPSGRECQLLRDGGGPESPYACHHDRAVLRDDTELLELGEVDGVTEVVALDVPGVPLAGRIAVQPQQGGRLTGGYRLAPIRPLQRHQQSPPVDHRPDDAVRQQPPLGGLLEPCSLGRAG